MGWRSRKANPAQERTKVFPTPRNSQHYLVFSLKMHNSRPDRLGPALLKPTRPMKTEPNPFRVKTSATVKLKRWPTRVKPFYKSKSDCKEKLAEHNRDLSGQKNLL